MKTRILSLIFLIQFSVSSFAITKNWIGTGAGAGNSDWNTGTNWSPSGIPGSADDVVIAISNSNATITFSGAPGTLTINTLTYTVSGNNRNSKIDIGGNTLIITSSATFNNPSGNSMTSLQVGVNGGTSAGVIDFGGAVTMSSSSNGVVEFIGNTNSKIIFRDNLTFGSSGAINSTNTPGNSEFTSATSQIVTFNSNVGNFNNVTIGTGSNNPIVTFTGSSNAGLTGNLTINGSSILDLDTRTFNRSTSGGIFSLNSTSQLKLGNSNGGVSGSNFPNNFSTINLSSASTVEYNAVGGTNQTIYATPAYGNLVLSRVSGVTNTNKTATAGLTVNGNLAISAGATFVAGNSLTHILSGDFTNNGSFSYTSSSIINFTGSNSTTINGSSTTAFNNIIINKGSNINSMLDVVSPMSMNGNLTLSNGLFRISNASASVQFGTSTAIASTSGIELNGGTINANNVTVTNNGLFILTSGIANIGNTIGNSLNTTSTGTFSQSEGTLNIAGRMTFTGGIMNVTGGILNICTAGNNSASASLDIDGSSALSVSGGTIKLSSGNSGSGYDLRILSGAGSKLISGGSIQIGNGSIDAFKINSTIPVYNFEMNSTGDATLISSLTINNTLTFTNGKITTGTNKVIIPISGTVNGTGTGKYVSGSLEKYIPASATTVTFEIGTPPSYAPVVLNFNGATNGTGSITAKCTSTDHPDISNSGINSSKSINRYWNLSNNGVNNFTSYDATFTFNYPSDVDATTNMSAIVVRRMTGSSWFTSNTGATSSTSAQALSVTGFGDFQIGETTGLPTVNCSSINIITTSCSEVVNYSNSSTGSPTPVISYSKNPGTSFNIGTTPVIVTATNINGSTNCSFDVNIKETQAPVFQNCPANITVAPTSNCQGAASWIQPVVTDNCSFTLSSNFAPGDIFSSGTHQVTYTATDASGNSASCSFNVTVTDNLAPVINCPSDIIVNAPLGSCGSNVNFSVSATDNCSATLTTDRTSGSFFPIGNTSVTSTAIDPSGNTTSCTFHVIVKDNELPVINGPSAIVESAPVGSCGKVVTFNVTTTDNCSATVVNTPSSGSFFPIGTTTVTSNATDAAGNIATRSFNVTVNDNELPVINYPASITVNSGAHACGAIVNFNVTSTDNCSSTVSSTPASGSSFPIGTTTVYSVATDASGNTSSCSFNVIVKDLELPEINCPGNISVNSSPGVCGAIVNFNVTAIDNCSSTVISVPSSGSLFPIGTTTVNSIATDASGNSSTCSFTVTVIDNEIPIINCPSNMTVNAGTHSCGAIVNFNVTASDNCSVTVTSTPASGSYFPIGTTTVSSIATDASGKSSNCTFNVTVIDNELPVINCPADISVNTENQLCGAEVNFNVNSTDNCSSTVSTTPASGSFFPVGTTTVYSVATDGVGNTTTCSFNVIVTDNEAPTINCPPTVNVDAGPNQDSAIAYFTVTATDNCIATITTSAQSGSNFPIGMTLVTCTATDASGNTSDCSFHVMVKDNSAPHIYCPDDIIINATPGQSSAIVNFVVNATDNQPLNLSTTPASGSIFQVGTTIVYSVATDPTGNSSTCSFSVTVVDAESPVLSVPADISVIADDGGCGAIVNFSVTSTDNNYSTVVSVPASGSLFPIGTTTVTSTAMDASGNTASQTFTVTVIDNENPVINCQSNMTINSDSHSCGAVVNFNVTATDNCSATVTSTPASGSYFPIGTTTVSSIAMDASGNLSSSCTFDVTVIDNELPVINCPADFSVNSENHLCGAEVNFSVTATDNCSATISTAPSSGSFFPVGTTTVYSVATDGAGNTTTRSFNVTVIDNEAPTIDCPPTVIVDVAANEDSAVVNFAVTVTDNCSATLTTNPPSGSVFPIGMTLVTCTATDASGNTSTCSFHVKVKDDHAPNIYCPADTTINALPGDCSALVNFVITKTDHQPATIISTPSSGSLFPVGTTIVNTTATDPSGNVASCSFSVTVVDAEFPILSVPANISAIADAGSCGTVINFNLSATDNCSATVNSIPASGSFFPIGTTTVTATATDISGNVTNNTFDVTVIDNESPVITCQSDINTTTDPGVNGATVNFNVNATDNCAVNVYSTPASGTVFPIGTTTVNSIATDASGNAVSCSFQVTVIDNEFPVIHCPADIHVNNDYGMCGAVVNFNVSATDNSSATVQSSHASGSFFPIGTTTVTSTATDLSGNISTCNFDVTVTDSEFPLLHMQSNVTAYIQAGKCSAAVTFNVTTTDNCSATVHTNPVSGSTFQIGTTMVKAIATDASGNTTIDSFAVHVIDTLRPLISCHSNMSVNATAGLCGAVVNYVVTASDNCSATVTTVPASGSVFPIGKTIVKCTSFDTSGNKDSCSFEVTVVDNIAPVISNCPATIVVNLGSSSTAVVSWVSPVATDNCSATLTTDHASGSIFSLGMTTVTYTATDPSGNTSTCSFVVNVKDNIPPSISNCPTNITVNTSGSCDQVVSWTPPTFTDNVSYVTTSNRIPGQHFPVGSTIVTYTATDLSGNSSSCSFTVKVEDHEIPVITNCPANISVFENPITHTANVMWTVPSVTDNCSYSFGSNKNPGSSFTVGTTQVIYTATDASGNTSTCSFTVTVTGNSTTSVKEISNGDQIVMYPNPMTSNLNIKINGTSMAKTYRVISILGADILTGDMNGFDASIGVESLAAGTYIVEIVLADGERFFKNVVKK